MGIAGGPKIKTDGLVFAIDFDSNVRGYTKYGTSGTNNNHRAIRNLVDRSSTYSLANTSQLTGGVTYYTLYGITYPEGNYTPAARDGITPGFENITAAKTYDASRDVNYYVFDEDTNTWVADSYFNGLRISGHCYDTYSSTNRAAEHARFQDDYDTIKIAFPNATHIVIGSHASENVDNDANTVTRLKEIGLPDDAVGLGRVEFVLVGKVNKPWTHHYVRENVNSAVANMVVGLPLEGKGGAIVFDGTDDKIDIPVIALTDFTVTQVLKMDNVDNQMPIGGGLYTNGFDYLGYTWFFRSQNQVRIKVDGEVGPNFGVNSSVWAGKWISYTATRSGSTYKLYINGVLYGTQTSSTNQYSIRTLGWGYSNSYAMQGNLAVTKIYNRALSADEVEQNFKAYKNRFDL